MPLRQKKQVPQKRTKLPVTLSPTLMSRWVSPLPTFAPTFSTMPHISWPMPVGSSLASIPERIWGSEPQMAE